MNDTKISDGVVASKNAQTVLSAVIVLTALLVLLLVPLTDAKAQVNYNGIITEVVGPFSDYPPKFNPYVNNPATGAPSAASVANATGVGVTQSGNATVTTRSGAKINVPVARTAAVSRAAIANAARIAVRGLPVAGAAGYTAYSIYDAVVNEGYTTCAPPQFFCKPADPYQPYDPNSTGWQGNTAGCNTAASTCTIQQASVQAVRDTCGTSGVYVGHQHFNTTATAVFVRPLCKTAAGNGPFGASTVSRNLSHGAPPPAPQRSFTDAEIEQAFLDSMAARPAFSKHMYDALKKDAVTYEGSWPNYPDPISSGTPVDLNVVPVTSPRVTVSTSTLPGPNGSTETSSTQQWYTITPVVNGNTVGNHNLSFSGQEHSETTTTNNSTGQTSTSTTTTNQTTPTPVSNGGTSPNTDTGPRECGSPGRPKCAIDETGTPTGANAIDKTLWDSPFQQATTGLTTVTGAEGKDTSWGWSPASWFTSGACEAFNLGTLPVLNVAIGFDVCPMLALASPLIAFMWVLSTIGIIYAMVWETMQGAK